MGESLCQMISTITMMKMELKYISLLQKYPNKMVLFKGKIELLWRWIGTMLNESRLSNMFWHHEFHTNVHILNRILLRNNNDKTPY